MTERNYLAWDPKWWMDPWWEDIEYQTEYGLSIQQIRARIESLIQLFDEQWSRNAIAAGPPNAILPILFGGKGPWPFESLMWLGRIAASTSRIPGVHRSLRELIGTRTKATLLELEVASWFVEQGWEAEFIKPKSNCRSPDISVRKDGILSAVECKRFEAEQWEDWAADLTSKLIHRVHSQWDGDAPNFDILFESRLSDLVLNDDPMNDGITDEIAHVIDGAVCTAFGANPPISVRVPGIAHIKLRPERGGRLHGIGGIEISPQAKVRRIVKNGIFEAAKQLKNHAPGAVVVRSDFTPPYPLVDAMLQGINRADTTLLQSVAVVVIPASLGEAAVIWQNPAIADHPVCRELATTFASVLQIPE